MLNCVSTEAANLLKKLINLLLLFVILKLINQNGYRIQNDSLNCTLLVIISIDMIRLFIYII